MTSALEQEQASPSQLKELGDTLLKNEIRLPSEMTRNSSTKTHDQRRHSAVIAVLLLGQLLTAALFKHGVRERNRPA